MYVLLKTDQVASHLALVVVVVGAWPGTRCSIIETGCIISDEAPVSAFAALAGLWLIDDSLLCQGVNIASSLLQAIHRYQRLTDLLLGKQPQQLLLPPTPQGYILTRVRALAAGPCMAAFTWNSGSSWGNKPWTNELPNDSTLVFFLFAAFLEVSADQATRLVIVSSQMLL